MANSILEKLKIKAPHVIYTLNAPVNFKKSFGKLPDGIGIVDKAKPNFNSLHWFVTTKAEVDRQAANIIKMLKPGIIVWCYYPKGTSKMQTDLTRDKGWDSLLKSDEIKWINLVSFNEIWSAFAFKLKTEKDKTEKKTAKREIFNYADSATKTIILPTDIAKAFIKNKKAKAIFDTLAFTHRREYIEWIITAKRKETKSARLEGTMKMLLEGKKNPYGR